MHNTSMGLGLICLVGALLLAFAAGWALGRANPSWESEQTDEDTMQYRHGAMWEWNWGRPTLGEGEQPGCAAYGSWFMRGTGPALICAAAALFLAYWGTSHLLELSSTGRITAWSMLAAAAIIGYIVSRVTDKGPVGPLK